MGQYNKEVESYSSMWMIVKQRDCGVSKFPMQRDDYVEIRKSIESKNNDLGRNKMLQFNNEVGQKSEKTENSPDKESSFSHWLMTASGLAIVGSFAAPAWAQDTNDPYDEIIVTAMKSGAQNLQDVGIAITALSSEDLLKTGTTSTLDVQYQSPGLVISLNGNNAQPSIRGVGSDIQGPGFEGPVAVYVDGIYQSRSASQLTVLTDVERVEVLKGPQTTLYGRNATGGAINIITFDPSGEFAANGRASYGNFGRYSLQGAVGGGLVKMSRRE